MTPTALTLARYSALAYEDLDTVQAALPGARVTFLDRDDSQAYVIEEDAYTVVAFRGTQVTSGFSMTDVLRNAKVRMVPTGLGQGGKVHRGYLEAVDAIADDLAQAVIGAKRPLIYTGHSLGGSGATIARTRAPYPDFTFTFGAPKVGNRQFVKAHARHHLVRLVHGRDIAPKHARPWLGYRHGGDFRHISTSGKVTERKWGWRDELLIPFFRGIAVGTFHHRIGEYVDKLRGAEV